MSPKAKFKPTRRSRVSREVAPAFVFVGSANSLLEFTTVAASLRSSRTLKDAIQAIDLSMEDLGSRLGRSPQFAKQRPAGFSKTYISLINKGAKPASRRIQSAIAWVMCEILSDIAGDPIGVAIKIDRSGWRFTLARTCPKCGPYVLARSNQRRCPRCKGK